MAFCRIGTYVVENDHLVRPAAIVVTDGKENAVPRDRGDDLLRKQHQQNKADGRKVKVVELEQKAQLERLAVPHQLPSTEYDNVVRDEEGCARLEGRDGRLPGNEAEILRLVAQEGLVRLLKDGPRCETERSVERRRPKLNPVRLRHVCAIVDWHLGGFRWCLLGALAKRATRLDRRREGW